MKAATLAEFCARYVLNISIHAAREGGDFSLVNAADKSSFISIHAAREGGDHKHDFAQSNMQISIHAAREGGDEYKGNIAVILSISIHAAREGGDFIQTLIEYMGGNFNPRRP